MAPEMHAGREYSYAADVWSLGCLLYELCALEPLFQDREEEVVARKVRFGCGLQGGQLPAVVACKVDSCMHVLLLSGCTHGARCCRRQPGCVDTSHCCAVTLVACLPALHAAAGAGPGAAARHPGKVFSGASDHCEPHAAARPGGAAVHRPAARAAAAAGGAGAGRARRRAVVACCTHER